MSKPTRQADRTHISPFPTALVPLGRGETGNSVLAHEGLDLICWYELRIDCLVSQFHSGDSAKSRKVGEIFPMGRDSGSVPRHPVCEERETALAKSILGILSCGKWFGCLVRGLQGAD